MKVTFKDSPMHTTWNKKLLIKLDLTLHSSTPTWGTVILQIFFQQLYKFWYIFFFSPWFFCSPFLVVPVAWYVVGSWKFLVTLWSFVTFKRMVEWNKVGSSSWKLRDFIDIKSVFKCYFILITFNSNASYKSICEKITYLKKYYKQFFNFLKITFKILSIV